MFCYCVADQLNRLRSWIEISFKMSKTQRFCFQKLHCVYPERLSAVFEEFEEFRRLIVLIGDDYIPSFFFLRKKTLLRPQVTSSALSKTINHSSSDFYFILKPSEHSLYYSRVRESWLAWKLDSSKIETQQRIVQHWIALSLDPWRRFTKLGYNHSCDPRCTSTSIEYFPVPPNP